MLPRQELGVGREAKGGILRYHKDPTRHGLPYELGKVNARSDKVPNRLGIVWNSLKETMTILLLYVNEIK